MMRYSEIARDLSSDSLRYTELGEEYIYKNLREESPPPSSSSALHNISACYSSPAVNRSTSASAWSRQLPTPQPQPICESEHPTNIGSSKRHICNRKSCQRRSSTKRYSNNNTSNNNCIIGNGTANGAATISYLLQRQRNDNIKSTHMDSERLTQSAGKPIGMKKTRRKTSIGCLNTLSSSPGSPDCYYCVGTAPPPSKSQSLPAQASMKNLDTVILSALRIPAEELACQITLLDFPVFAAIQPDEMTSCAWTKKDKHTTTPNIVAFTKRFNHTIFWTVQEILSGEQPKQRAEILAHFIKVAKKLHELNNLHSLFAIISAMQSASIYRLKKTWICLSKKDKQSFDRLSDIFSDQNNWENLRAYLESLRLPCIPYLGLFLTDLIYIDLAHPHKGGLEPEQRRNKMNNLLRVIANYQQSDYSHILQLEGTQKYLTSIRYIEELQNIFEEDQYKKSLKLEPASPSGPSSSSCSSKESFNVDAVTPALACLNLSPAKTIGSMRIASGNKFIPGHRKCRSLGTNIFGKMTYGPNDVVSNNYTPAFGHDHSILSQQPRHLLDDSVLEHGLSLNNVGGVSSCDTISNSSADGISSHFEINDVELMCPTTADLQHTIQGCVRRKTLQKEGRKPAVASWQRYWLQIWANSLVYFPPKSFKGCERSDFKREPCKVCPLDGWYAHVINNPKHKNSFELYHRTLGSAYKFRTDSPQATHLWTNAICKVASQQRNSKPLPINLMSFE